MTKAEAHMLLDNSDLCTDDTVILALRTLYNTDQLKHFSQLIGSFKSLKTTPISRQLKLAIRKAPHA